jgi:Ca-activated chloride channel family protein
MEALMRSARQSGVVIYAVGLLTEEEHREASRAKRALNDLTEATGGSVFFPKEVSEVDRIAHQVAHDIRNQYTIAYSPLHAAMDGTFRQIKIIARAPGSPLVRTRSGYYATPDPGSTAVKNGFTK